jgi:hypothetical protein
MAKQILEIKDFSGGLNCSVDARDIEINEFAQIYNISSAQEGILKCGGGLVQNIFGLPHSNTNFQEGYGLFALSFDSTPYLLAGQLEGAFEEGTLQTYTADDSGVPTVTLSAIPTYQSAANHGSTDFYRNLTILIYHGNGIGQSRRIVAYNGTSKKATITDTFSTAGSLTAPDGSSKYKIFQWTGDNSTFGNEGDLDYIDKGGTDFPWDDITSHSQDNSKSDSYFLRTKVTSIANNQSKPLGFIVYNANKDATWVASGAISTNNTNIGNTTLHSGVEYFFSFWVRCSAKYYNYVSTTGHGDVYPFVQIYSDSVTDGTNTGLYLFQTDSGAQFMVGADTDYQYYQNLDNQYIVNGDFETGTATAGGGGYSHLAGTHTYCPPTSWMAYDGFIHNTNNTITYSYINSGTSNERYGNEGNSLNMAFGSAHTFATISLKGKHTKTPSSYLYQDIELADNQWYDLSFAISKDDLALTPAFAIIDTNKLTSTGIVSNESTEVDADGDVVLTVDTTTATDALVKHKEIYKSDGTFLGVCTAVNSGTEIRFAAGTAADIPNDTTLYTAEFIRTWDEGMIYGNLSATLTDYKNIPFDSSNVNSNIDSYYSKTKFFVSNNSGTPKNIRIAFSAFAASGHNMRLDSISVKKSLPNLESMSKESNFNTFEGTKSHPMQTDVAGKWIKYGFNFKIPKKYNNATDWVIGLNAGRKGFQDSATGNVNNHTVYFDKIQLETKDIPSNLILLNDNTSTNSKINIYNEDKGLWIDNTDLKWDGINMKPVYHYINGMLKISDANFESGNSSKLMYYDNGEHKVRDSVLSLPPVLGVRTGFAAELAETFNGVNYMNAITFAGKHEFDISDSESNRPVDKLNTIGRILYYQHENSDTASSQGLVIENGSTAPTASYDIDMNKTHYIFAGTATGSDTAATTDMDTSISSYSTGSVSRVKIEFTYSFQGSNHYGTTAQTGDSHQDKYLKNVPPPKILVHVGKRNTSGGTDIFDESDGLPTATEKQELITGRFNTSSWVIEEEKVYTPKLSNGNIYLPPQFDDGFNAHGGNNEGLFNNQESWYWDDVYEVPGTDGFMSRSTKSFIVDASFEDGLIEKTDDICFVIEIDWGVGWNSDYTGKQILTNNKEAVDSSKQGKADGPVYERLKIQNAEVFFRNTNWSSPVDGLTLADSGETMVNLTFSTPTGASALGWEDRAYNVGVTSVNIFDEESSISTNDYIVGKTTTNNIISEDFLITAGQCPDVSIYIGFEAANNNYRKKLKYYMKDTESDIWYLQFYVDLQKMKAYSTTSNYSTSGERDDVNKNYTFNLPKEKMLNYNEVQSYESETLVSQDLNNYELICDYKTGVIANNRFYAGNIRQNGEIYPDRMIKSPINKYNILPKSNFIDVAINDGDEITALEYYRDKILQFKRRKVFIINISGDYEFLEETLDNIGVNAPYQVCKTPYGIAWANESGLHLYDGNQTSNLIDNKITNQKENENIVDNWWQIGSNSAGSKINYNENNYTQYTASVGYDPKQKDIIVKRGIRGGANENSFQQLDAYIYNLVHKSWYMTQRAFNGVSKNTYQTAMSNFANDSNGNLISYNYQANDTYAINDIMKWKHAEADDSLMCASRGISSADTNERLMYFTTPDYTFGNISVRKKIYKIYITYKSDVNTNILINYRTNGSGAFNNTFLDSSTNYAAATGLTTTSNNWETAELKPTNSINNIYSFQMQFTDGVSVLSGNQGKAKTFKINDISIVYRAKRVK